MHHSFRCVEEMVLPVARAAFMAATKHCRYRTELTDLFCTLSAYQVPGCDEVVVL